MSLTTQAQLFDALNSAEIVAFEKPATTVSKLGGWVHYGNIAGYPQAFATPSTGAGTLYDNSTAGALQITTPGSGTCYLAGMEVSVSRGPVLIMVADLLWRNSGLSGTSTALQSFSGSTITRYESGGEESGQDGTRIFLEVFTLLGTTSATGTVTYTDGEGGSGATGTIDYTGNPRPVVRQVLWMNRGSLSAQGANSVQSMQWSVSTGTAGNFGLGICRPITCIYVPSGVDKHFVDFSDMGIPITQGTGCHSIFATAASVSTTATAGNTQAPYISGSLKFVYG